jgi:hypothetical protein
LSIARSPPLSPPWTLDEANDACFIVRDHNGDALAYCRKDAHSDEG